MTGRSLLFSFFCIFFFVHVPVNAQDDVFKQLEEIAIIDQRVMMPMRDGIRLMTDIYRPKTNEKVPIIFSRTPYNFNPWQDGKQTTRTAQQA